jgi:bifunctional DNA-binding transcriptional regulator/antitoxin component of YhaV-PrlF toxin-antitoxin module
MDRHGRVVIPRAVRERYGLLDDSHRLEIRESAEGILLRPKPVQVRAERHSSGWLVFRSRDDGGGRSGPAVEKERERRHRQVRGQG